MNTHSRAHTVSRTRIAPLLRGLLLGGAACAWSATAQHPAQSASAKSRTRSSEPTAADLRAEAKNQRWPGGYGFPAQKIQAIQYLLRAWGIKTVAPSGQWDEVTLKGLDEFARGRGLGDKASPLNAQRCGSLIVPLSVGSRNDGVRALQSLLRERGYDVPVDGVFTPALKLTLIRAQMLWGLRPPLAAAREPQAPGPRQAPRRDGIMDAATWAELLAPAWQITAYPIEALQCLLRAHGSKIPVTGTLDAGTKDALTALQKASGLVPASELNAPTLQALSVEVRPGERSDAVRALQILARGLQSGPKSKRLQPDGLFGESTSRALRQVAPAVGKSPSITFSDWFILFDKVASSVQ